MAGGVEGVLRGVGYALERADFLGRFFDEHFTGGHSPHIGELFGGGGIGLGAYGLGAADGDGAVGVHRGGSELDLLVFRQAKDLAHGGGLLAALALLGVTVVEHAESIGEVGLEDGEIFGRRGGLGDGLLGGG